MKRFFYLALILFFLVPPFAVASNSQETVLEQTEVMPTEENVEALLHTKSIPVLFADILGKEKNGILVVLRPSTDITNFGTYVYYCIDLLSENYTSIGTIDVVLRDNDNNTIFHFMNLGAAYGTLFDSRSGKEVSYKLKNLDDLMSLFPAMYSLGIGSSVSASDLKIYNEVFAYLDKYPNRPESELIEEIAPTYNMTADELHAFLRQVMDALY